MTTADIVTAQRRHFTSGATRNARERKNQLRLLKRVVIANEHALLDALAVDLGKPRLEAVTSELVGVVAEIDRMIAAAASALREHRVRTPLVIRPGRSFAARDPYGSVLIIGPWNYPVNLTLVPVAAAIATGNTVVVKPSELAPRTAAVIETVINNAFAPEALRVVTGNADTASDLLNQQFDLIFYTGGTTVGRIVARAAAKRLIPTVLELGGKNPCIVEHGVAPRLAARRIAFGKFFNAGQTCIAPDTLLVDERIRDDLISELETTITRFYGGDPRASDSYGRIVNDHHFARLVAMLDGAAILSGGRFDVAERYIEPTIVDVRPAAAGQADRIDTPLLDDEVFGPILPVLTFGNRDELGEIMKLFPTPLALYAFSRDRVFLDLLRRTYRAGSYVWNDTFSHIVNAHLPFGGVGTSGHGSYRGEESLRAFTRPAGVFCRGTWYDPSLRYPPYAHRATEAIRRLLLR